MAPTIHNEPHVQNPLRITEANSSIVIGVTCPIAIVGMVLNLLAFGVWVRDVGPFILTIFLFKVLNLSQFLTLALLTTFCIVHSDWLHLWVDRTAFASLAVFYRLFFQMTVNFVLLLAMNRALVVRFPSYCEVVIKRHHVFFTAIIVSIVSVMEILLVEMLALRNPDYTEQIHVSFIACGVLLPCVLVIACNWYIVWRTFRLRAQGQRMEGGHNMADLTCCTLTIGIMYSLFLTLPTMICIPLLLSFKDSEFGLQRKTESLSVVDFFWTLACSFSSLSFFCLPRFRALLLQPLNRCHRRPFCGPQRVVDLGLQAPVEENACVRGEGSEELGSRRGVSDDPST